jgi:hypothetical protein
MTNLLIITGAAPSVWADIERVPDLVTEIIPGRGYMNYDFMAIGLDAVDKYAWPIRYVATYHPAEIQQIKERRQATAGNTDYQVISHETRPDVDIFIKDWWRPSGSSSLLGVQAALQLGYQKIILCGCPLTGESAKKDNYNTFHIGWTDKHKQIKDHVRSMSGWTKELLGAPTEEWLHG